jgi:integrase
MRLQEIFNLTWQDLDFKGRRIEIRKSKTDHVSEYQGRTIVMSINARIVLIALHDEIKPKLTDRVFPKSKNAFKQAWADVRKRAKITGLTFHDLRREAGSRFDEAELTTAEHNLMLGHTSKDMSGVYIASKLKRIQDKLDRHFLGEKTWEELEPNERKRLMDKVLGGLLGFGGGLLLKKMLAG